MTKWHAHVVPMAKHMDMVGGPFLVGALYPGPLGPPKSGAANTETIHQQLLQLVSIQER